MNDLPVSENVSPTGSPRIGDWVLVHGQVINDPSGGDVHPDDLVVEFFSHNFQWCGLVERCRVTPESPPDFAGQCTSLHQLGEGLLLCDGHFHHGGVHGHKPSGITWTDDLTTGYFEAKS